MKAAAKRAVDDPTAYPVQDDMCEGYLQSRLRVLRALIERWLASQGRRTLVGADQFFYWKQFDAS
jgi:hypothetical protein